MGAHEPKAGCIDVVVEIPRGSRNKYEFDEEAGVFRLDRVLASAVHYNFDYGFIEGTRAGDGDHTDALLLIDEPTFPGCHVWARPIGVLEMRAKCRRLKAEHGLHLVIVDYVQLMQGRGRFDYGSGQQEGVADQDIPF